MKLNDPVNAADMTEEHYEVQTAFVNEYIKNFSPSKAARAVGFTGNTPGKKGEAILAWPGTKARVREALESAACIATLSKAKILAEMWATYEESKHAENPKPLESARILDLIWAKAGFEQMAEDKEVVVSIKKFTAEKKSP